ncbi:MAG: hypothetical protein ACPGIA_02040 [Luteolibacter sp.]
MAIRPYCVAKKENYHIGASFGRAIWIDWQHAKEMASEHDDKGMLSSTTCLY